jgi:hypothetical protein
MKFNPIDHQLKWAEHASKAILKEILECRRKGEVSYTDFRRIRSQIYTLDLSLGAAAEWPHGSPEDPGHASIGGPHAALVKPPSTHPDVSEHGGDPSPVGGA